MALEEPEDDRCSDEVEGGYCARWPAVDDEGEVVDGKCSLHGEAVMGGDSWGAQEGSGKHNLYSWRSNYYYSLDRQDQIWLDLLIESFLDDAPFGREDLGKLEILRQVAIDTHKIRTANYYIWDEGLAQMKTIDFDEESGEEIEAEVENILNLPVDRLQRQCVKRLKELGCLDDPDSSLAESTQTLAEVLSGVEEEHKDME